MHKHKGLIGQKISITLKQTKITSLRVAVNCTRTIVVIILIYNANLVLASPLNSNEAKIRKITMKPVEF